MIDTTTMTLVVSAESDAPSVPFVMGFTDGLEQPFDFTCGVTWDRSEPLAEKWNEHYDTGVNVGQNLMRLLLGAFA